MTMNGLIIPDRLASLMDARQKVRDCMDLQDSFDPEYRILKRVIWHLNREISQELDAEIVQWR